MNQVSPDPITPAQIEALSFDELRDLIRTVMTGNVPEGGLPAFNFEAATEAERWAYDQGREDGHREGYDQAINDAIEHPGDFTARLLEIRPGADPQAGRWTDTGSGPGYTGRVIPPVEGLHDSGDDAPEG